MNKDDIDKFVEEKKLKSTSDVLRLSWTSITASFSFLEEKILSGLSSPSTALSMASSSQPGLDFCITESKSLLSAVLTSCKLHACRLPGLTQHHTGYRIEFVRKKNFSHPISRRIKCRAKLGHANVVQGGDGLHLLEHPVHRLGVLQRVVFPELLRRKKFLENETEV